MDISRSARPRSIAVLVSLAALLIAACTPGPTSGGGGEDPQSGGTLRIALTGNFELGHVDVLRSVSSSEYWVGQQIYEPLYQMTSRGGVEDWLAERTEVSSDGLTWTITVRDGVKFHDGTDLDAAAVKDNFDRRKALETFLSRAQLDVIEEIRVKDSMTVEFLLSAPAPSLRGILSSPGFGILSPTALAEHPDAEDYARNAAGTGPFKLQSLEVTGISLVRFDDYWGDTAYLDGVEFSTIGDQSAQLLALEAGDIDVMTGAGGTDIPRLRENPELTVVGNPAAGRSAMVWFNHSPNRPTSDPRIRDAVIYATDKEALLPLWEQAEIGDSFLMPGDVIGYAKETPVPHDPERAKDLFAEAGFTGKTLKFIVSNARPEVLQVAQLMKQDLERVGVNLEIVPADSALFRAHLYNTTAQESEWDMGMTASSLKHPDVEDFYFVWLHSDSESPNGFNWSHYVDPEMDNMIEEQVTITDPAARNKLLLEIHSKVWKDKPFYPLARYQDLHVTRAAVRDYEILPNGSQARFHRVWLDR